MPPPQGQLHPVPGRCRGACSQPFASIRHLSEGPLSFRAPGGSAELSVLTARCSPPCARLLLSPPRCPSQAHSSGNHLCVNLRPKVCFPGKPTPDTERYWTGGLSALRSRPGWSAGSTPAGRLGGGRRNVGRPSVREAGRLGKE